MTDGFYDSVYTSLVPSNTFVCVTGIPNATIQRFTPCGRFLVTFSNNQTDVGVYRLEGGGRRINSEIQFLNAFKHPRRTFSNQGALIAQVDVPTAIRSVPEDDWFCYDIIERHTCHFSRFFSLVYSSQIAYPGETLARDFCLVSQRGRFLILASFLQTQQQDGEPLQEPADVVPALRTCPVLDRFVLHLVEAETGRVYDRFTLENDFVRLDSHPGVHMLRNQICVLSLRHQTLHILRVQEAVGRFVVEREIGPMCNADDQLEIARVHGSPVPEAPDAPDSETGLGNGKRGRGFYTGLMQRLLTYIFRRYQREGNERVYFQFVAQYSMLVMLKAQLLDDDHLLILLGSDECGKAWDFANQTCFFVVYCMSSTRIVNLFDNKSVALLQIFESHHDMFFADAMVAAAERRNRVASTISGQLRSQRGRRSDAHRKVRRALSLIPVRPHMRNASPYLDRRLYSYDLDRMDSTRGSRTTVKFTSVQTRGIRFRLTPGAPVLSEHLRANGAPMEQVAMQAAMESMDAATAKPAFLFHPMYPFVISTVSSGGITKCMSFHVIGHQ